MTWRKSAADRRRDAQVYQDPVYRRNRAIVMARANGRCECPGDCGAHEGPCGRRDRRIQCDHVIPVSKGGGHDLANLRAVCAGPPRPDGTPTCHAKKTAQEGGGYRAPKGEQADPPSVQRTRWA